MPGRSILVVGANGFVGSHVARELVAAGHRVTGFGLPMPVDLIPDLAGRVQMTLGSAEVASDVDAAFDAARPDLVVWCAGHNANAAGLMVTGEAQAARALAVNAGGLFNVLEVARKRGAARAVITGSLVVLGPAAFYPPGAVDESAAMRPTTGYGLSKAMGEQAAQYFRDRFGMDVCTLRLSVVFGPGRWYGGVVGALAKVLAEAAPGGHARLQVPAEPFDAVHVRDVAAAVRLAVDADRPLDAAYNVNGFTTTYPELARSIERHVPGMRVECSIVPASLVYPLVRFDRIQRELGYAPGFDLDATVADCLAAR